MKIKRVLLHVLAGTIFYLVPSLYAATLSVTSLADSGPGSLRDTLAAASPGDSIVFSVQGTIVLSSGKLVIDKNIQIVGPGANQLFLDGQATSAVCSILSNATVSISDLTITNGVSTDYLPDSFHQFGGGVQNFGNLTMTQCLVTDCLAEDGIGGGIYNCNTLTLRRCSIFHNRALDGGGIGDLGNGSLTVDGCTISENGISPDGDGAGVTKYAGESFMTNSTISGNSGYFGMIMLTTATLNSCTIVSNFCFYSIFADSFSVECENTIIADTLLGSDVSGKLISDGYNLIQNTNGCTIAGNTNGNLYGKDPLLGPLQDNGGPTFTHALLPGSPAIDAGSRTNFPGTDQRGFSRPQDGNGNGVAIADIGAFEAHGPAGLVVTSLADSGPGTLREAVTFAQTGDTIRFAVQGSIVTTNAQRLVIDKSIQINGPGPDQLTTVKFSFFVSSTAVASLTGLAITGASFAGGIQNFGNLTLTNCIVSDCMGDPYGGGIQNFGNLTLTDCLVTNCFANPGGGGGIGSLGNLTLIDCVITHCNSAFSGGGIACSSATLRRCTISNNSGSAGGGIHAGGALIIDSCTISGNVAADSLDGWGGGILCSGGPVLITNSTISGNTASSAATLIEGGGIYSFDSDVHLESCTVVSNFVSNSYGLSETDPSPLVGAGISAPSFVARNTIIAGNASLIRLPFQAVPSDCLGIMLSQGFNLIQSLTGLKLAGDQTGCIFGEDPRLGPLRNNGGPTFTHALLPSSPAIDQGFSAVAWDQRGFPRSVDLFGITNRANGSDIGAFEVQPGNVAIEAEWGTLTSPMTRVSDTNASQGAFIYSPAANSGTASYNVTVPAAANFVIWCRVLAANYNSDSFFVSMDGGPELIYDAAENIQVNAWQWTRVIGRTNGDPVVHLNPRVFPLSAGNHTLVFRGRDPGTKLDRFLVTSDTNFIPVLGFEAESGTLSPPMAVFSAAAASHGQYIASPVTESGQASFPFGIPATNQYFVWCRVLAANANADSFYVSMDGGPELIYDTAENMWTNVWQWSRLIGRTNGGPVGFTPRVFNLAQTMHALVFRAREANSRLDRILITSDPIFNPASDFDQPITNQMVSGFANADQTFWLWENAPWRDLTSYKITSLPWRGTLYQYAGGVRGPAISINSVVSDPAGRVIFSPEPNTCGHSYANLQFTASDSIRDPASVMVSIDIAAPPVHIASWSVSPQKTVSFRFLGIPQTTYNVLESTNLLQTLWKQRESPTEISSGLYEFNDISAAHTSERFFRVSWQ